MGTAYSTTLKVARNLPLADSDPTALGKVFFRGSVQVIKANSVYANQLCDVKMSSTL